MSDFLTEWTETNYNAYFQCPDMCMKVYNETHSVQLYDLIHRRVITVTAKTDKQYNYHEAVAVGYAKIKQIDLPVYYLSRYNTHEAEY